MFDSWTAAVEAAGYQVGEGPRETITQQDVIEHIQELALDLGQRPIMTAMNDCGGDVDHTGLQVLRGMGRGGRGCRRCRWTTG